MSKSKIYLSLIFFSVGLLTFFPTITLAQDEAKETKTPETNVEFSVKAIQPESQVDPNISFFYPAIEPDKKQELKLEINNRSDEKLILDIDLIDAATGINGNIDYNQKNAKLDESLDYPLSDIAKVSTDSLTLKKQETKTISIYIEPKKESFPGVKLGAVRVLKHVDKEKRSGIVTNYGYTIGILVNEEKKAFNIGGDLVYKKTAAKIVNGRKTASTNIQNPKPYVIQNLEMTSTLYKDGEKTAYGKKSLENMSIAPNTSFDFPIDLGLKNLEPGKYQVKINAKNDQDTWQWVKEFTVSQEEADAINEEAVYKLILPKIYYYAFLVLILLTFSITALLIFLTIKKRRIEKKKQVDKRKKSKRKKVRNKNESN